MQRFFCRAGALALALILAGGFSVAQAGGKTDKDLLQGKWTVESAKKGGEDAPKELVDSIKLTIKGDKISLTFGDQAKDGTFKLDSSKKPKQIDLDIEDKNIQGIYELKGDTFKVVGADPGAPRPKDFKDDADAMVIIFKRVAVQKEEKKGQANPRGDPGVHLVVQREKDVVPGDKKTPEKPTQDKKSDKDKVQGDWLVEYIEKGNEKVPDELTKSIKVTIKGDKISILFGGETKDGTFKVDEKKKHIDTTIDGKKSLGIYKFDGDKLKICSAEPDTETRPTDFKGEDNIIFVFKRAPKTKEPAKEKDAPKEKADDKGQVRLPASDEACCDDGDTVKTGKSDRELLQGGWTCVAAERSGDKAPAEFVDACRISFKDGTVTMSMGKDTKPGTYELDPAKSPRHITLKIEGESKPGVGIYKIDGDLLTLAVNGVDQGRPEGFVSAKGQRFVVLVFKRGATEPAKVNVAALQDGARRQVSANNLKQIGLALHTYHDAMRAFPTAAIADKDGKPLLSWRIAILPYIEQNDLYQQFKLNEPWDSPANMKLLAKMPAIYGEAKDGKYETYYQVFVGKGTIFDGPKGVRMRDITDGTSNTAMVVEAGTPVPWTKPADVPFDAKKDLPKLGGLFKGGLHILLADGSVRFYTGTINPDMMRWVIQRNDGMAVDLDKLTK